MGEMTRYGLTPSVKIKRGRRKKPRRFRKSNKAERPHSFHKKWKISFVNSFCKKSKDFSVSGKISDISRWHPEFLKRRSSLAKTLKERVVRTQNFIWEDRLLSEDNLYEADVLITDRSGIAFEYAFGTERAALFIDTPLKEHNKNWKQLGIEPIELQLRNKIGVSISLERISEIPKMIDSLLGNRTGWRRVFGELRERSVCNWGHPVKNGVDYLRERSKRSCI